MAEEADDYDLRRRAVGRTISLLAKLCRDESQLLECLTDPVFDSYRADRSDLIEVLLSFSSSNQQTVIALREVASSITKARRDAGEPIREEVDVRHTLATEPGQEPSVTEDVDADTLPPLSEPPLAVLSLSACSYAADGLAGRTDHGSLVNPNFRHGLPAHHHPRQSDRYQTTASARTTDSARRRHRRVRRSPSATPSRIIGLELSNQAIGCTDAGVEVDEGARGGIVE